MSSLSRSVLLALLLLVVFLGLTGSVHWWLGQETERVRAAATAARASQLEAALAVAPRAPELWDDAYRARLGALLGGAVSVAPDPAGPPAATGVDRSLQLSRPLPGHPGWTVHAHLPLGDLDRLQLLHKRALVATLLLAAVLVIAALLAGLFSNRPSLTAHPWARTRAEATGLEHFARVSVERGQALEQEHDARRRAEENLAVSRTQLDRSLAERIRLGRELHDNTSQTLYAVTLTLESVRRKLPAVPEAATRLDQCMAELKRLNREVRAYLRELEPERVQQEPFASALAAMLASLPRGDGVRIEHRIDEAAAAAIPTASTADVVNIIREAVSNGLRHGRASHVTIRAERDESSVALAVTDDGVGFESAGTPRGHGLANMEARAHALGGTVRVTSAARKGTRVLLTLPVPSPEVP